MCSLGYPWSEVRGRGERRVIGSRQDHVRGTRAGLARASRALEVIVMPRTNSLATRPWPLPQFADWPDWPDFGLLGEVMRTAAGETIRVEELVEDDMLVIRAELPGIDPEKDVEVSISGGVLHIAATRSEKFEHKSHEELRSGFRSEFRYGSFTRSIVLPVGTYETEVVAKYADGILEVRLPITAAKTHKIEVKH
jgi:HSP20 family protein